MHTYTHTQVKLLSLYKILFYLLICLCDIGQSMIKQRSIIKQHNIGKVLKKKIEGIWNEYIKY